MEGNQSRTFLFDQLVRQTEHNGFGPKSSSPRLSSQLATALGQAKTTKAPFGRPGLRAEGKLVIGCLLVAEASRIENGEPAGGS